jgi:hypothetical protein
MATRIVLSPDEADVLVYCCVSSLVMLMSHIIRKGKKLAEVKEIIIIRAGKLIDILNHLPCGF